MEWRSAIAVSLPLLSSSTRAKAREGGLGEEEGGRSGPNLLGGEGLGEEVGEEEVEEGWSGDLGGLGKRAEFLSKKDGWVKRPSNG